MPRLKPEQYRVLANLQRLPEGRALLELLRADLAHTHLLLQGASGPQLGWAQGQAQCLAEWLRRLEEAPGVGR